MTRRTSEDKPTSLDLLRSSRMEINGNSSMLIEGRCSILEYLDELIRFKLGKKQISISGTSLELKNVRSDGFEIFGNIMNITFD